MRNTTHVFVAAAIALTALTGTACNRERAESPEKAVDTALERERVSGVDTDWDADNRVLHLKGTVASDADRARAEAIATQAVGTSGKVANELTLDGPSERAADNLDGTLEDHIEKLIEEDPTLKGRDLDAAVNNGVVTLTGDVASDADKKRLNDLVARVPGVQEVVNSVKVVAARR